MYFHSAIMITYLFGHMMRTDAISCYECSSYQITGGASQHFNGFGHLRDTNCEEGSDVVDTSSFCSTCATGEQTISFRYRDSPGGVWYTASDRLYVRVCETIPLETACNSWVELGTVEYGSYERYKEYEEQLLEGLSEDIYEADILSIDGTICDCNTDLCNGSSSVKVTSLVFTLVVAIERLIM